MSFSLEKENTFVNLICPNCFQPCRLHWNNDIPYYESLYKIRCKECGKTLNIKVTIVYTVTIDKRYA